MTQTVPLAHLTSSKPTAAEASSRKTLNGLALAVAKAKRIVVVTGAGISCSSGIPDFRSSDGLYNLVKSRYPDVVLKGRDLFDAALFRDPTSSALFYTFMAELKTQIDCARPAPVHDFLAMLDAKGKLLRSYTQNIDGLEERAGLSTQESAPTTTSSAAPRAKNVQLHGDIHRVRCTLCSASYPCAPDHIAQFRTGVPPDCPECIARSDARTARAARALKCGTLRPAIVLYDEPHPLGDHIGAVQTSDLGKKPDLLIVMGTSLKVHGLRSLVKSFAKAVHSSRPVPGANPQKSSARALLHNVLFVNRTPPPPGEWAGILDYHVQGDADTWVAQVLSEWKRVRPVDWEVQSTLDGVGVGQVPRPLGAGKKATQDAAAGGKKAKSTKGKSKAGAGAENMPPEQDDSAPQARFKIVLPGAVGKRRVGGAAGLGKSPLKAHRRIGLSKSVLARSPGLGVSKSGMGKSPLGVSKSPGLLTPAKKATTPFRIGLKRPAASPLTPRQPRIDDMFRDSPISAKRAGSTLSIVPSRQPSEPSQSDSAGPSTSCSTPYPGTSASSSQADLLAPSSQVSRSSTQDSIFSSQDSQSTAASSLADLGSVAELGGDCGAGSSGSGSGLGSQDGGVEGSQSTVGPGSQDTQWSQCTIGVGTQSILGAETQNTLEPETQDTIMASPRPFYRAAIVPAGNRSSEPLSPTRYLGAPRPPPFKSTSVGSGQTLFSGSSQPVASSSKVPTFGPHGPWSRSASQSFGPPPRHSSATGRQFARHSSTSLLPNHERRATQIPIPGKDFYVSASGERRNYNDPDTDSEEDIPLASQVSITAPPPPSQSMLAARGREELDSDVEVLDEVNPPRGLLFSAKGKGVEGDTKMEVVDVDPSSTESDAVASKEDDDSMSLDGAVGHMSLDGPSRETSDADVDVVGIDSEAEGLALPTASQLARSPVQTRAKRRAKEVQAKRATKRAPRTRVAGTRTSSRLAAMASS